MADTETVDVWNAASAAARQLFTQGVSPNMLHAMQNISMDASARKICQMAAVAALIV